MLNLFVRALKSEPYVSFSGLFRSECKHILYLVTFYACCVYPGMSKSPKQVGAKFSGNSWNRRRYNSI